MQHAGENHGIALSQLVEGNPVATIVIDAQHRVTHWNRACAVLTGVPAAEMIGSSTVVEQRPKPVISLISAIFFCFIFTPYDICFLTKNSARKPDGVFDIDYFAALA